MSDWYSSEKDTADLRAALDCPPEACVYTNEMGLMAVVYCQVGRSFTAWHLFVSGQKHRMPAIEEVLDAIHVLLPGIEDWAITVPLELGRYVVHVVEVPEERIHATRQ